MNWSRQSAGEGKTSPDGTKSRSLTDCKAASMALPPEEMRGLTPYDIARRDNFAIEKADFNVWLVPRN
jgi:hypothetical protein